MALELFFVIKLRLDIAYDGTDFHGWAVQPGLRTVQGEVEKACDILLGRVHAEQMRLTVGGRTDAGVHASGQVAHLDLNTDHLGAFVGAAAEQLHAAFDTQENNQQLFWQAARRLNGVLKRQNASDVLVRGIRLVPKEFDARFSALYRRYEYRIASPGLHPLESRRTAEVKRPVDFEILQAASAQLVGLHDFGAFCKAREGATTVRTLTHFQWRTLGNGIFAAHIQADAFCHSMVRALVGCVAAAATGRIKLARISEILQAAKRTSEFTVMPAHGLSLEEIAYPENSMLAAQASKTRARRDPFALTCEQAAGIS